MQGIKLIIQISLVVYSIYLLAMKGIYRKKFSQIQRERFNLYISILVSSLFKIIAIFYESLLLMRWRKLLQETSLDQRFLIPRFLRGLDNRGQFVAFWRWFYDDFQDESGKELEYHSSQPTTFKLMIALSYLFNLCFYFYVWWVEPGLKTVIVLIMLIQTITAILPLSICGCHIILTVTELVLRVSSAILEIFFLISLFIVLFPFYSIYHWLKQPSEGKSKSVDSIKQAESTDSNDREL